MTNKDQKQKMRDAIANLIKVPVNSKNIKSIGVNPRARHLPKMKIEIGKYYKDLEPGSPLEEIIAIFESKLFCVCTPNRNGINAPPYYFLREDVFSVEYEE